MYLSNDMYNKLICIGIHMKRSLVSMKSLIWQLFEWFLDLKLLSSLVLKMQCFGPDYTFS